jgi:sugar/nucleoside kinase (ribokinase family)
VAEIICVGILVADVLARSVDSLPPRGKLMLVEDMKLHIGGCAANTAIDLARIGLSAGVIGKVGQDGFGDFVLNSMREQGVEVAGVARDQNIATSATMVLVHKDGERSFIHYLGANAALTEEDIDFNLIKTAKLLHVAGSLVLPKLDGEPTARLLKKAKEAGMITALDTVWDAKGGWMNVLRPCLPYVDYFLPSLEEAKMLTGLKEPPEIASALLAEGVGTVALKMADKGSYVRDKATEAWLSSYRIQCVDATGAGDAFVAGFLTGVMKGWDLKATALFANAVGALACLDVGTTSGVRSLEETQTFQKCIPLAEKFSG